MALLLAVAVAMGAHKFTDTVGVPRSASRSSWPARSRLTWWPAGGRENQRRHLFLAGDQRRAGRADARSGGGRPRGRDLGLAAAMPARVEVPVVGDDHDRPALPLVGL